jgi:hypothetical protein
MRDSMHKEVLVKIDKHLKEIAGLNANIGIDSTNAEKTKIRHNINEHMKAIKELDNDFYEIICPDKKDKL